MKRFITSKKGIALLAALVVAAAAAIGAYAYWTASGSGSGTASVGTDSGISINNFAFSGGPGANGKLYPGGSVDVAFDVNNLSSSSKAKVGQIVADTSAGTNGITGLPAGCSAADFHFTPGTAINAEINASGTAHVADAKLSMDDTGANQDACKNASPVLHLKVDNSGL